MRSLLTLALMLLPIMLSAEALPQPPTMPDYSFIQTILMLVLGMVFFYFILYRPEQQKRKALEDSKEKMKIGDRVVAVGILGTVHKIQKDSVIIKTAEDTKIELLKAAINEVIDPKLTS